jgi:hypothetical protein
MKEFLLSRRSLLTLGATLCAGGVMGSKIFSSANTAGEQIFSARNDTEGRHWCESYTRDGELLFRTQVPYRAHDVALHPAGNEVLFVARRPGTECYWLNAKNGEIVAVLTAKNHRHFYGHGVFDPAGERLYLTENDTTQPGRGVIGVYRYQHSRLVFEKEFSTHGIGPHQIIWLPASNTLAVANGGIRTEAESRKDMNLHAMEPSLVIIDTQGNLLSKDVLPEQQASIRHLAALTDDTIVSSHQYMGEMEDPSTLLAIKYPGKALRAFPLTEEQHALMHQYTASVAINSTHGLMAVSAPRGNRVMIWNIATEETLLDIHLPDCAGIAATQDGFLVSSGQTRCVDFRLINHRIEKFITHLPAGGWDNHLIIREA